MNYPKQKDGSWKQLMLDIQLIKSLGFQFYISIYGMFGRAFVLRLQILCLSIQIDTRNDFGFSVNDSLIDKYD